MVFFCNISEDYKKKQQDADDNTQSMASLKWSTAELKVVSMSSMKPRPLPLMKPRPLPLMKPRLLSLHLYHYCRTSTMIFSSFLIRMGFHWLLHVFKKYIVGEKKESTIKFEDTGCKVGLKFLFSNFRLLSLKTFDVIVHESDR